MALVELAKATDVLAALPPAWNSDVTALGSLLYAAENFDASNENEPVLSMLMPTLAAVPVADALTVLSSAFVRLLCN